MDLTEQRRSLTEVLAELQRDHDRLVAASEGANADDEHDPEGATVGFERAQLAASIERIRGRLRELDEAANRVATGTYGRCQQCGAPIGAERLAARPATRTCIRCA